MVSCTMSVQARRYTLLYIIYAAMPVPPCRAYAKNTAHIFAIWKFMRTFKPSFLRTD